MLARGRRLGDALLLKLGKLLVLLLGLAVVAWVAKTQIEGSASGPARQHTQPRQQLDNVRDSARRIENDAQRRADETMKKAEQQ
jgi:hypothetical protein